MLPSRNLVRTSHCDAIDRKPLLRHDIFSPCTFIYFDIVTIRTQFRHSPHPRDATTSHVPTTPGNPPGSRRCPTISSRSARIITGVSTADTPSIRQIGRNIRPARGASTSAACVATSASNASNCAKKPAASHPSSRTIHPRPDGKATGRARASSVRSARTRVGRAGADGRVKARQNRRTARLSRPHSSKVNPARCGIFTNRRAINAPNPAMIAAKRRANSGAVSGRPKGVADMFMICSTTNHIAAASFFVVPHAALAG